MPTATTPRSSCRSRARRCSEPHRRCDPFSTRCRVLSLARTEADGPRCASKSTTDTISAATRSTPWRLVDELRLGFDAGHPQGMARVGTTWWISTVDKDLRRGFLLAVDDTGALLERVPVGDDRHYHPGGMDFDGHAFWIAGADYLPDSSTIVYRVEPGGIPQRAFDVDDHIGAIARCGDDGDLVGWSWGSRRFLRWSIEGDLRATRINPGFFIDHQDCQWLDTGH
ncbi:MAG TPA: DUF6454 family protein, partial [Ilumatobacteraceae bacterium]|nr:DUF6454 family protein [Ilumatobacteraceae bacterium]